MVLCLLDLLQMIYLTVVPDTIARDSNRNGATQAAALDISKASDRHLICGNN